MQKLSVIALSFAATAIAFSPLAGAADKAARDPGKANAMFKKHDADNDGTLDRTEAKATPFIDRHFEAIDTDKDGTISMAEIQAFSKAKTGEMHAKGEAKFKAADKDGDGTLDPAEAKAMPHVAKHFADIDADKDGTVTIDEIHGFMKSHHHGKK